MVRRAFFSFHYERDIWRANVVRNSWFGRDRKTAGFWDALLWEEAKTRGYYALKRMIDTALKNTSVTAVLIGRYTSERDWVLYEIEQSYKRGNGLLGIYIHNIRNKYGYTDYKGKNPFDKIYINTRWGRSYYSRLFPTYYWKQQNGYYNIPRWIEEAARRVGR